MPDPVARPHRPPPLVFVVVPPEQVVGAGAAMRQVLSLHAGAPWPTLLSLAERGLPAPVGGARNERLASQIRDDLVRQHGLRARVVDPGGLAWFGLAVVSGVVACIALIVLVVGLVAGLSGMFLAGGIVALLGLLGLGGWGLGRWRTDRALHDDANRAAEEVQRALATAPEAWTRLLALREASLAPTLPPSAQADLWVALDDAEERLMANPGDADVQARLDQAERVLGEAASAQGETTGSPTRPLQAERAARAEAEGPPPPPPPQQREGS